MRFAHFTIVITAAGCSAPSDILEESRWSRDTVNASFDLVLDLTTGTDATPDIGRPIHVRSTDSLMFIADRGNDRVAVIDARGHIQRWIGAQGRGPGEILGIAHLAIRSGELFVAEALNGRVSQFTLEGSFIRAYLSPFAAGAIGATNSAVFAAARSQTHYAMRLENSAEPRRMFRRTRLQRQNLNERWRMLPGHDLIAADSSQLWILDQGTALLCAYVPPRQTGTCRALPHTLVERLGRYRDERVAAFEASTPVAVQAAPIAKDMLLVGGYVALLLPLPDLPVVLIDVADGAVTPLIHSSDPIPLWARGATSFAWDGRSFVLVSDDGIGRLHISRPLILD